MIIDPCHYCGTPVYNETAPQFRHDVVCSKASCQEQKQAVDARTEAVVAETLAWLAAARA